MPLTLFVIFSPPIYPFFLNPYPNLLLHFHCFSVFISHSLFRFLLCLAQALCGHCPAPPRLPPPEMDVQSHCPNEYQEPDIVIISLIGVLILAILVAIAAVVLCVYKNRTGRFSQKAISLLIISENRKERKINKHNPLISTKF